MELAGSLTSLRSALSQARFPLALPDRTAAQTTIHQIVSQLDDYVLPRLVNLEAPLLAVVGGSTGAGKSTLVNALIPGVDRATGEVNEVTGRGRHTSTSAVALELPDELVPSSQFSPETCLPSESRRKASHRQRFSVSFLKLTSSV